MDSSLLKEFKNIHEKWLLFGEYAKNLDDRFYEVADRFEKALRSELPVEVFDGVEYRRVEKVLCEGRGLIFTSDRNQANHDCFTLYADIVAITPVREG